MAGDTTRVHATCVDISGAAVLLRGPSGVGKSDLALRLIDASAAGSGLAAARLIADDQVCLTRVDDAVIASAPPATAGKIEVRGLGIIEIASSAQARLALVVDLMNYTEIERLPEAGALRVKLLGVGLARIAIDAAAASAPARIRAALGHFLGPSSG
ncbi:MAG: HPr kinase/phosphorylase [Hyphomicrobiales bacterium]